VTLDRDGTCHIGAEDFAGFVWVSLKMYVPSRRNCATPLRGGPPILSPFTKYNDVPIPTPKKLQCTDVFALRVHVYQAKDLPAANPTGMANAFVKVKFAGFSLQTHSVIGSNSPTWDETLCGKAFIDLVLPCLGWPGENLEQVMDDYKYNPKDEEWEYETGSDEFAERWMRNYNMLRAAPRIEIQVVERFGGRDVLLGRCYVKPEECYHTQCDPRWHELFKGNPEMDEGNIYFGVQLVHHKDPLYRALPGELLPQRTTKEQMDMAFERELPGLIQSDRSRWVADGGIRAMEDITVPHAFFNRNWMPCSNFSSVNPKP
jgi:hypothetical protein